MTDDPVCGMVDIDPKAAFASAEHEGETYFFCSSECEARFLRDPERYVEGAEQGSGGSRLSRLADFFGLR